VEDEEALKPTPWKFSPTPTTPVGVYSSGKPSLRTMVEQPTYYQPPSIDPPTNAPMSNNASQSTTRHDSCLKNHPPDRKNSQPSTTSNEPQSRQTSQVEHSRQQSSGTTNSKPVASLDAADGLPTEALVRALNHRLQANSQWDESEMPPGYAPR
jgi:hypothetical protein